MKNNRVQWVQRILVGLVVLIGLGVRMINLYSPPLDFHLLRQMRGAIVARGMYYQSNPAADPELRAQATRLAEMDQYEPSMVEEMVAFSYRILGSEQVWVSRIFTSVCWLIGGLALFALARRYTSFWPALISLGFYLFLPFAVLASRAFMPDPWMVMWILLAALALDHWAGQPNWRNTLAAGLVCGIAILVKAYAGFAVLGMLGLILLFRVSPRGEQSGRLLHVILSPKTWLVVFLTALPSLMYYLVLNSQHAISHIDFWTVRFDWMLITTKFYAQWLATIRSFMDLSILALAVVGTLVANPKYRTLLLGFWAGYFLMGLSFPFQYTTHDYYHLQLVPLAALGLAPIWEVVVQQLANRPWLLKSAVLAVVVFVAGYNLWVARSVLVAQNYNNEPIAWKRVGDAIPKNTSAILLTTDYGVRLNYYGWWKPSQYWPSSDDLEVQKLVGNVSIEYEQYFKSITQGCDLFVVVAFEELDRQPQLKTILETGYPVLKMGDGYLIYDLRVPKAPPSGK